MIRTSQFQGLRFALTHWPPAVPSQLGLTRRRQRCLVIVGDCVDDTMSAQMRGFFFRVNRRRLGTVPLPSQNGPRCRPGESCRALARTFDVHHGTISKLARQASHVCALPPTIFAGRPATMKTKSETRASGAPLQAARCSAYMPSARARARLTAPWKGRSTPHSGTFVSNARTWFGSYR